MLDPDVILAAMNQCEVECLLIGGMNFLLNHRPETTYDVDLWANPVEHNRVSLNVALFDLRAEWGPTDATWRRTPVDNRWLFDQSVYCLTTPFGALDIFFDVRGLEGRYAECAAAAVRRQTAAGTPYLSLSDEHMLRCQEAAEHRRAKAIPHDRAARSNRQPRFTPMTPQQKKAEEAKRERMFDPLERWRAILSAIAFAEENTSPELRRNRPRWHPGSRLRNPATGAFE